MLGIVTETTETIYFDGGARGNGNFDCLAGWAYVDSGTNESRADHHIGATNNEMEYLGLIWAIDYAISKGYKKVVFKGDSMLVVKQVLGEWKCKALNLKPLLREALELLEEVPEWTISWVPREVNLADAAYNEHLDSL